MAGTSSTQSSQSALASEVAAQILANYKQHPYPDNDRGPVVVRVVWILIAISTAIVITRLWTKARKTRRLYWDDALIVLALILGIIQAAFVTWSAHWGLGRHMLFLSAEQREESLRTGFLTLVWCFASPMAGRMAFCVTVLYLTGTDPRVKRWPVWLFLIGQFVVNMAAIIVFYTQCGTDIAAVWTQVGYLEKCSNPRIQTDVGYAQGAFNTLTDAFLTAIPALLIGHTRLSLKEKLGLASLLCLSMLAMIASIVKTYEAKALSELLDYTYDLCPYVIWISIELNVVIIVACIPLIRPLFIKSAVQRIEQHRLQQWDTSTFGSILSKKGGHRTHLSRIGSQECIVEQHDLRERNQMGMGDRDITVTTEVSVTYQPSDLPFVHAALVGLVQGEIANPRLAQR